MYDDEYYDRRASRNPMATASVVLGVLALLSFSIFYISLPCGALAIICAILSRSHGMLKRSIAGIICGTLGIVLSVCVTIYAVYYVLTDENGRSWLQYYLQMYTGDSSLSLDDFLNGLYDTDGNSSGNEENGDNRSVLPGDSAGEDSGGQQDDNGNDNSLPGGNNNGGSLPDGNSGNNGNLPNGNGGSDSLPDGNYNNNSSGSGGFVNYSPGDSGASVPEPQQL